MNRSTVRAGSFRRSVAALGVMSLIAFSALLILAGPATAAPFTGGLSPTVIGGLLDMNGDNAVNGADDSNAFYGDTAIINGGLDCDAWSGVNGGEAGDGVINGNDDCLMLAYDGTSNGVTITVTDGSVVWPNGPFPTVFPDPSDPDNPGVLEANFAWSTIDGRVDSNGDETIDEDDCSFDVVGTVDVLGNTALNTNPCGFANPPDAADNGKVDLNSDGNITAADTCLDGCFLGHNVILGVVQGATCPGFATDPRNQVVGTPGDDDLAGTSGRDIICGLGGNDSLDGRGGSDLLIGGSGADVLVGRAGADVLRGGIGNDRLVSGLGNDRLNGGSGRDRLIGGPGRDRLSGGTGNDRLFGGFGSDRLFGGPGRDLLHGGPGRDFGAGGPGRDTFRSIEIQRP